MIHLKKAIALILALSIFTVSAGCSDESDQNSADITTIATEATTINEWEERGEKEWQEFLKNEEKKNQESVATETTSLELAEQTITDDIDRVSADAKAVADVASPEDIQSALDKLRELSGHFYDSSQNMYDTMYYAQMLYYYYKDTNTPYEQAGFYAFTAVKYVYRGIDTVDSPDTADSLTKFAAALMQCDDINNEVQEVQEVYTEPPVQQSITVYITPTGKRYHYDSNCNGGNYSPTDLDTAKSMGLEPCKKCT